MVSLSSGSSPRMRGTRIGTALALPAARLIPTYAGNTRLPALVPRLAPAHPHVCGEHLRLITETWEGMGSSPRMRGTLAPLVKALQEVRLIPTYAGNTSWLAATGTTETAHPHVCGEHEHQNPREIRLHGSSPRMRGTLLRLKPPPRRLRLIPTYAGNTTVVLAMSRLQSAHPHVCGEH